MYFELALIAYLIDYVVGEFPVKHPVMWMGDYILAFERRFYSDRVLSGAILVISLLLLTLMFSLVLVYLSNFFPVWLSLPILALLASTGLAMDMLYQNVAAILTAEQPKKALSNLVSRDTLAMTETEVYKAALETWAENLSDGVIAPLFYLVLFGLPGIATYKAINTLDSMVAYKTDRYYYYGKVAAKLDDIANIIPARLTALLIILLAKNKRLAGLCCWRDGNKLESPNAGYPIAAMAGALAVKLGGNAFYHGEMKLKPALGTAINSVNKMTLAQALKMKTGINIVVIIVLLLGIWLT
jgi:adenosylcobinamide-phosphate synthase